LRQISCRRVTKELRQTRLFTEKSRTARILAPHSNRKFALIPTVSRYVSGQKLMNRGSRCCAGRHQNDVDIEAGN
jgi:hypothetical protein